MVTHELAQKRLIESLVMLIVGDGILGLVQPAATSAYGRVVRVFGVER